MSDMLRLTTTFRKQKIDLSIDERTQLNVIIDLLIPSDQDFPPPSSLHLIDELLLHLLPRTGRKSTLMLSEKRLRTALIELNLSAGGNFCLASTEKQQSLLRHLEYRDPAFFQALWTLVNHSYYAILAQRWQHSQLA
ncbi:hypothetical protein [Dictyobacter arantiisoli]|uniref:Uncharacterized protein n=1 Tax=Dictyobacter arantiisoli TaxID=2014874 RepID=A0A5A5T9M5_9CHLR|nr:hypothetical protein [Dictyobacter arantiisoli]GCF08037.1 hypothetical protein KDI_16010 [Dictyobacter arantiisoli]